MATPNKARLLMWAKALKSGQYQQGNGNMRKDNKYCCLGVAMDMAIANGVKADPNWGKTSTMPDAVCEWYGLDNGHDPALRSRDGFKTEKASVLNDNAFPFVEIADRIIYTYNIDEES